MAQILIMFCQHRHILPHRRHLLHFKLKLPLLNAYFLLLLLIRIDYSVTIFVHFRAFLPNFPLFLLITKDFVNIGILLIKSNTRLTKLQIINWAKINTINKYVCFRFSKYCLQLFGLIKSLFRVFWFLAKWNLLIRLLSQLRSRKTINLLLDGARWREVVRGLPSSLVLLILSGAVVVELLRLLFRQTIHRHKWLHLTQFQFECKIIIWCCLSYYL